MFHSVCSKSSWSFRAYINFNFNCRRNALFTSPARIPGPFKAITCHQKGAGTFLMMSILKPSPFFSFEILPGTCFHDSNRWRKLDIGWPCDLHSGLAAMMTPRGQRNCPSLPPENGTCGSQSPAGLSVTERLPKGPPKQIDSKESLP